MAEMFQHTQSSTQALGGFIFEECSFNVQQTPSNNGLNQNWISSSTLPSNNGLIFGNSFPSSQFQSNMKTLNVFGESNNDQNFFMTDFDQEINQFQNEQNYPIKKESYCEMGEQQQYHNQQNIDFFNEKAQTNNNNNGIIIFQNNSLPNQNNSFSKNQQNNNLSSFTKNNNYNQLNNNNNQTDVCITFLFPDCNPNQNYFTQGNSNNFPQEQLNQQQQQQQYQQQTPFTFSHGSNVCNQNLFSDLPLTKADSIVDGIQCEIPSSFFQDITTERARIQQSRLAESGKSYQFERSFGNSVAQHQQSQSSQQCMLQNSQNQIYSTFKQQFQNYHIFLQQDQLDNLMEEASQQIAAKKEEENSFFSNINTKTDQMINPAQFDYDHYEIENSKNIDQSNIREQSTRSQTYSFINNGLLTIPDISNMDSSYPSCNQEQSSYPTYTPNTPNKTKRISKKKEKSLKSEVLLNPNMQTERAVEQKEDRKRSKKTLFYKGSDGKQKKFARITKSMIRPVCNAVCRYLRGNGAIINKMDWLNELRSFLIINQNYIPTAVDFFQNHFEKYVMNSPKLIEKEEYMLFKENWIRGVSDPENFKGLKQVN